MSIISSFNLVDDASLSAALALRKVRWLWIQINIKQLHYINEKLITLMSVLLLKPANQGCDNFKYFNMQIKFSLPFSCKP